MKRVFKIIGIIILVFLLLQASVYFTARYGWKLVGFDLCESPDVLLAENVFVTEDRVYISGTTASSASAYVGFTYKFVDNTLYLGIKQNLLFGFDVRNGSYSFRIEGDFEDIESVCLVGGDKEKCIWTLQKDKMRMERIKNVRLYESVSVSSERDYMNEMRETEFVYADKDLLYRIQHPVYSDDLYLAKGGGYLGVAELEGGDEVYLEFDRHFEVYNVIGKIGYYEF